MVIDNPLKYFSDYAQFRDRPIIINLSLRTFLGTQPRDNDLVNSIEMGIAMEGAHLIRNLEEILSGSAPLDGPK